MAAEQHRILELSAQSLVDTWPCCAIHQNMGILPLLLCPIKYVAGMGSFIGWAPGHRTSCPGPELALGARMERREQQAKGKRDDKAGPLCAPTNYK
jgi:hypothetical protein